jgi:hypothetical protein
VRKRKRGRAPGERYDGCVMAWASQVLKRGEKQSLLTTRAASSLCHSIVYPEECCYCLSSFMLYRRLSCRCPRTDDLLAGLVKTPSDGGDTINDVLQSTS